MRYCLLSAVVFVLSCCLSSVALTADYIEKDGKMWMPLFDGKTLDGWETPKIEGDKKAEVKDGVIILGREGLTPGIKYNKEFPKSNYEIIYEAKRVAGYDFFGTITFPVKESHCSFVNGGWGGFVTGISSINGYDASENETSSYYEFKDRQWYRFRICVSDDRILVWFHPAEDDEEDAEKEGETAASDKKPESKEEVEKREDIEKPKVDLMLEDKEITTRLEVSFYKPLGLTTWNTEGHIRDIRYRELSLGEIDSIKNLPDRFQQNR
jgi:Domain of Unknown Function (DUF1080).